VTESVSHWNGKNLLFQDNFEQAMPSLFFTLISLFFTVIASSTSSIAAAENSTPTAKEACPHLNNAPDFVEGDWDLRTIEVQFNEVRDLRSRLLSLLPDQKVNLDDVKAKLKTLQSEKKDLDAAQTDTNQLIQNTKQSLLQIQPQVDDLKNKQNLSDDQKNQLTVYLDTAKQLQQQLNQNESKLAAIGPQLLTYPDQIKNAQLEVDQNTNCYQFLLSLQDRVEQRTLGLLIPTSQKNSFRLWLSFIYAGIVLVLIGGFYGLAFIDRPMRRAIFGRQAGIQFITLFSLVIAIILFGVLEILADKELAALLGGISGYILGRVSSDRSEISTSEPGTKTLVAPTISFTAPATISDSSGGLAIFATGDRIRIAGSQNNNGSYTIASVSQNSLTTNEQNIQNEGAGTLIRITSVTS
jgi:hypothetical protein